MSRKPRQVGRRRATPKKEPCCHYCRRRVSEIEGRLRMWAPKRGFVGCTLEIPKDHPCDGWICDACHEGMLLAYMSVRKRLGSFLQRIGEWCGEETT